MNTLHQLKQQLGEKVQENKNISPYITIRTNTTAEYFFEAETREDLINVVKISNELEIPLLILGGGSNLAVTKSEIKGLVVRNMYQKMEKVEETDSYTDMLISSGFSMSRIVAETTKAGLAGFEYHLGLPGTLGGAMYMNSKWTNPVSYTSESLQRAYLITRQGEEKEVNRDYFNFAYDYSIMQETGEIFIEGIFRLQKSDPEVLQQKAREALTYRKNTQPFGVATAGCFFQNISDEEKEKNNLETKSAGYLIDKAGFKGKQIGSFVVSDKHANFIINKGEGKPEDLKILLDQIKETVFEKFGVKLKEEVVVV